MNALVITVRAGATAKIVRIVGESLSHKYNTKCICIDDYDFQFCKGCRSCHTTAKCFQHDDVDLLMEELEWADIIVSVSPSYWHLLIGVPLGAIPTNPTRLSIPAKKAMPSHCGQAPA